MATAQAAQIIMAPSREPVRGVRSVFLAGITTGTSPTSDWRATVAASLSAKPITIFNPFRADWDSSWREDPAFPKWHEQVEWELEMQERADIVIIYFGAATDAPIGLLEFGLCAKERRALVVVDSAYSKRGNVLMVCQKYGIEVLEDLNDVRAAVTNTLGL